MSLTLGLVVDVVAATLWLGISAYFFFRYLRVTHKLITLSLHVMALSCAAIGLITALGSSGFVVAVVRGLLLVNAIFVAATLKLVHAQEKR